MKKHLIKSASHIYSISNNLSQKQLSQRNTHQNPSNVQTIRRPFTRPFVTRNSVTIHHKTPDESCHSGTIIFHYARFINMWGDGQLCPLHPSRHPTISYLMQRRGLEIRLSLRQLRLKLYVRNLLLPTFLNINYVFIAKYNDKQNRIAGMTSLIFISNILNLKLTRYVCIYYSNVLKRNSVMF